MPGDINKLRRIISAPSCGGRVLDDQTLSALLERYPCYELAAYHACIIMAQDDSLRLPDGTDIPSQRQYWLNRARQLRPVRDRPLKRADEAET